VKRALVVQSDETSAKLANDALGDMFAIEFAKDFPKAYEIAEESFFDVVVCNVNETSFEDAMHLVKTLKSFDHYSNSPFIILSEVKNNVQLSRAFDNGCDEYLAAPIEPAELKIRVRARVKDLVPTPKTKYFWASDLRFCAGTLRVVATDDTSTEDLELTPNEFRILFLLSRHLNKTLTRDFILKEVWGQNMHVVARTVDKHICSLRRKLGRRASYLVSVPNKGYMFHVQAKTQKEPLISAVLNSAS
jgi:DNA-binding response OmpR family regulator